MRDPDLGERVAVELARADRAWQAGQPGRARVCARRAAGWALLGRPANLAGFREGASGNAYQALKSAVEDDSVPSPIRLAATRLTVRVDEAFSVPFDQDPIEDALEIIRWRWPGWQPFQGEAR